MCGRMRCEQPLYQVKAEFFKTLGHPVLLRSPAARSDRGRRTAREAAAGADLVLCVGGGATTGTAKAVALTTLTLPVGLSVASGLNAMAHCLTSWVVTSSPALA
jgi:alcohol dehydrogenase class IV